MVESRLSPLLVGAIAFRWNLGMAQQLELKCIMVEIDLLTMVNALRTGRDPPEIVVVLYDC